MKTEHIILSIVALIAVISLFFAINITSLTGKSISYIGAESLNPYNIGDVFTVNITEEGAKFSRKNYVAQYDSRGLNRLYPIFVKTNITENNVKIKIVSLGENYAVANKFVE